MADITVQLGQDRAPTASLEAASLETGIGFWGCGRKLQLEVKGVWRGLSETSGPPRSTSLSSLQAPGQPWLLLVPSLDRSKERPDWPEMGKPTFKLFCPPSWARQLKIDG